MPLTDTQLLYYDSNVLRLPDDKRKEYHRQVDFLIDQLSEDLRDEIAIRITGLLQNGYFRLMSPGFR